MNESFFKRIRLLLTIASFLLAVVQVVVFSTESNFAATLIVLGFSLFTIQTMVRADLFRRYPISTFQILAFWGCSSALAVVATLLDGSPLVVNLKQPATTFTFLALTGVTLVASHWVYRLYLQTVRRTISVYYVNKLGLFRFPSLPQVVIISLIGLASMAASRMLTHDTQVGDSGEVGVVGKFIQGFIVFAYAPFVLPFLNAMRRMPQRFVPADFLFPGIYFVLIMGVSLAANNRSSMMLPVVMIIFTAAILVATGLLSVKAFASRLWLVLSLVFLLGISALSDVALAMQAARVQRGKISPAEMMKLSMEIYGDSQRMEQFREGAKLARYAAVWDEVYVNNPLISRFITTKYHDLGFGLEAKFSQAARAKLRDFNLARVMAIFPAPIVNALPFGFRKSALGIVCNGDFMYFLVGGTGLGGFRTGSMVAEGVAMWGFAFFPILGFLAVLVFTLSDSLVMTPAMQSQIAKNSGLLAVPLVLLINDFTFVNIFQGEAVDAMFNFVLRGFWQATILYAGILFLTSPFITKQRGAGFASSGQRRKPAPISIPS